MSVDKRPDSTPADGSAEVVNELRQYRQTSAAARISSPQKGQAFMSTSAGVSALLITTSKATDTTETCLVIRRNRRRWPSQTCNSCGVCLVQPQVMVFLPKIVQARVHLNGLEPARDGIQVMPQGARTLVVATEPACRK